MCRVAACTARKRNRPAPRPGCRQARYGAPRIWRDRSENLDQEIAQDANPRHCRDQGHRQSCHRRNAMEELKHDTRCLFFADTQESRLSLVR